MSKLGKDQSTAKTTEAANVQAMVDLWVIIMYR